MNRINFFTIADGAIVREILTPGFCDGPGKSGFLSNDLGNPFNHEA